MPEVQERVQRMKEEDARFRELTRARSRLDGNVVFTDFRGVDPMPVGNRFIVYTLFPQANISLRVHWGPSRQHVAAAVGHSIFNRTSRTNVGFLMSKYGGGGHKGAGTCLLPADRAEELIAEMIATMKQDG
jgi:nanoRNase/pAp phosphatase (c-di-AMP/oligoRNAs hydrolase)